MTILDENLDENINPLEYGITRERSEGTFYLMKKSTVRKGWAEEVAGVLNGRWVKPSENQSKYMVLWNHVSPLKESDRSMLLEILRTP